MSEHSTKIPNIWPMKNCDLFVVLLEEPVEHLVRQEAAEIFFGHICVGFTLDHPDKTWLLFAQYMFVIFIFSSSQCFNITPVLFLQPLVTMGVHIHLRLTTGFSQAHVSTQVSP